MGWTESVSSMFRCDRAHTHTRAHAQPAMQTSCNIRYGLLFLPNTGSTWQAATVGHIMTWSGQTSRFVTFKWRWYLRAQWYTASLTCCKNWRLHLWKQMLNKSHPSHSETAHTRLLKGYCRGIVNRQVGSSFIHKSFPSYPNTLYLKHCASLLVHTPSHRISTSQCWKCRHNGFLRASSQALAHRNPGCVWPVAVTAALYACTKPAKGRLLTHRCHSLFPGRGCASFGLWSEFCSVGGETLID